MNDGDTQLDILPWLENWWKQTENPLYAWEALARCLAPDAPEQPLPAFVREYFRAAAVKMLSLSYGRHWENDGPVEPDDAPKFVGEALGLWRERSKNAFARRRDDGVNHRAALDDEFFKGPQVDDLGDDQRRVGGKWLSHRQATRKIARGRKLNRPA